MSFGSKGSSYATFKSIIGGQLESIKLKYKSGYVTCKETKSAWHSHWGCGGKSFFIGYFHTNVMMLGVTVYKFLITFQEDSLFLKDSRWLKDDWLNSSFFCLFVVVKKVI